MKVLPRRRRLTDPDLRDRLYELLEHDHLPYSIGSRFVRLIIAIIIIDVLAMILASVPEFDARFGGLFTVIGEALEVFHLDVFDRTRHQLDVADFADAGRTRRRSVGRGRAAAHRELLARIRQVALQLLALFHQGGDARRHVVERGAQLRRR